MKRQHSVAKLLAPFFGSVLLFAAYLSAASASAQDAVLTFDRPETAGISGFRALWNVPIPLAEDGATQIVDPSVKDRSPTAIWSPWAPARHDGKPGALAFDALNRSLLVRFPDAATAILNELRKGYVIDKVELVLPYRDTELWPPGNSNFALPDGYLYRANWGVDKLYRKLAPQWHAVAWGLRRAWRSNDTSGPTFNAYVNGSSYWTKYGAGDLRHDRFPVRFGPAEVSQQVPVSRLDVTALVKNPEYGKTLADRVRHLACCGFIVNKLETYDARFYTGHYEWATATGGRAILIKTPRLVVTFSPGKDGAAIGEAAETPTGDSATAAQAETGGAPTATLPSEAELTALSEKFAAKPSWMPPWQWNRIAELRQLDGPLHASEPFYYALVPNFVIKRLGWSSGGEAKPFDVYCAWVDSVIGRQPRGWSGFEPASEMAQWFVYGKALPAPARDAFKRYWTAWLMPDRKAASLLRQLDQNNVDGTLVHPQLDELLGGYHTSSGIADSYYAKTGDWRGNKSFYRAGYTDFMSTENFNHTAATGALLGGAIIGSKNAMADGRHGWETFPVRLWSWSRGASQENIDHYYFAITLSDQKVMADFAPTLFDRLMSEGVLAKSMDELIAAYHPALRRFIAGSSRTSLEYLLAEQDGLQYLIDTLSRAGALHDVGNPEVETLLPGLRTTIGQEVPPWRVALQATTSPWAPEWASNLVDDKPLPYRAVATGDGVEESYLGHNYGVATATRTRRIQFLAQWRRTGQPVEKMSDVVTVVSGYGVNDTRFANDGGGWIAPMGSQTFLQHDNKVLMAAVPRDAIYSRNKVEKEGLKSLQASIAFFNYQQPAPDWEIYVDGKRVTRLPYVTHAGARIVIRDGETFFGAIPLPGIDLGGGNSVVLREGTAQMWDRIAFKPALVIDSYALKSEHTIAHPDWDRIKKAFGGFAIELADRTDFPSFKAFEDHLARAVVQTSFDASGVTLVSYQSGHDRLETNLAASGGELTLIEPKVNGHAAFPPAGILRDTTTSVQGTTASIEKLGAVLRGDKGRMKFLQVEPKSQTFVAWNPLPDLDHFSFLVPGGIKIQSDGGLGLARVEIDPVENRVAISQAWRGGQEHDASAATALVLSGFTNPPSVEFNGAFVKDLTERAIHSERAYVIPLQRAMKSATEMEKALAK
jgi:hypothetical protein